jgi:hypothetical protein
MANFDNGGSRSLSQASVKARSIGSTRQGIRFRHAKAEVMRSRAHPRCRPRSHGLATGATIVCDLQDSPRGLQALPCTVSTPARPTGAPRPKTGLRRRRPQAGRRRTLGAGPFPGSGPATGLATVIVSVAETLRRRSLSQRPRRGPSSRWSGKGQVFGTKGFRLRDADSGTVGVHTRQCIATLGSPGAGTRTTHPILH